MVLCDHVAFIAEYRQILAVKMLFQKVLVIKQVMRINSEQLSFATAWNSTPSCFQSEGGREK